MPKSALRSVVVAAALGLLPVAAYASIPQPSVVSSNAVNSTPQLVPSRAVGRPHVDAIASAGGVTVAAGRFDTVKQGGKTYTGLSNIVAFDSSTGQVRTTFKPSLTGGQIWALAMDAATGSLFVGGDFSTVNGAAGVGLVKLDLSTGRADKTFKPYFSTGHVKDLKLATVGGRRRLLVAGGMSKRLASVDPVTGAHDKYVDLAVTNPIPGARGNVSVQQVAVNRTGTRLVATGNFRTVNGQARTRFMMLDLGPTRATLSSWYFPGFAKPCSGTAARRIAYLQGVDWSPDGKFFDVAATGRVPLHRSEVWRSYMTAKQMRETTVCDATGRFAVSDQSKPVWVNYTGGDSTWSVADTGSAVYVQGHFKWLDNPDGFASIGTGDTHTGSPATRRAGLGAINPATGRAIQSWHPATPVVRGGRAIRPTRDGVWFGNDSARFGSEPHYGLAFAPLG